MRTSASPSGPMSEIPRAEHSARRQCGGRATRQRARNGVAACVVPRRVQRVELPSPRSAWSSRQGSLAAARSPAGSAAGRGRPGTRRSSATSRSRCAGRLGVKAVGELLHEPSLRISNADRKGGNRFLPILSRSSQDPGRRIRTQKVPRRHGPVLQEIRQ